MNIVRVLDGSSSSIALAAIAIMLLQYVGLLNF
jgi:hypothetical protein